jgi:hypothetical protein
MITQQAELLGWEARIERIREKIEAGKKRDRVRQRMIARLAELHAIIDTFTEASFRCDPELHAAFLEFKDAVAEARKLPPLSEVRRFRGKTGKTKLGRPSVWRGYTGMLFVDAVNWVREKRSCSIKQAICYVAEHTPGLEELRGVKPEALHVRYLKASRYWALFLDPVKFNEVMALRDASSRRMSAAIQGLMAPLSRARAEGKYTLSPDLRRALDYMLAKPTFT